MNNPSKLSKAKMSEKNPMWKGDQVGYGALHTWVRSRLKIPKNCQICKKVPPKDLANKGIYNRELKNWEWLCRSCHMNKDGRKQKLMEQATARGYLPEEIRCKWCGKIVIPKKSGTVTCSYSCAGNYRWLIKKSKNE